jgi:hypothetical protein
VSHRSDHVTLAAPRRTMRATALSLAACGIALVLHQGAAAVAADTPAKPAASADTGTAGDTSTITSLTPEGARKLIAEEKDDTLFLPGVTALDADTAVVLAEFDGRCLVLDGLTTLAPEVATALAGFKGSQLGLDGVEELSPQAREALGRYEGEIFLKGLATLSFTGTWVDTEKDAPGQPLVIVAEENGLWVDRGGTKVPLEKVSDAADMQAAAPEGQPRRPDAPRKRHAIAVIDDGVADRHLRIERMGEALAVEMLTVFKDGSGRPNERSKAIYANPHDFLPNGYEIFFANRLEAALVKDGVNFGACIAGPHVAELGNSGNHIFGRIDPKEGLPPHPDHAPGFFLIDSATDKATTGLDREPWLAALKAVGIESPRLGPPVAKWPKRF